MFYVVSEGIRARRLSASFFIFLLLNHETADKKNLRSNRVILVITIFLLDFLNGNVEIMVEKKYRTGSERILIYKQ